MLCVHRAVWLFYTCAFMYCMCVFINVFVYFYICVFLFVYLCICVFVYLCICVFVYLYLCICHCDKSPLQIYKRLLCKNKAVIHTNNCQNALIFPRWSRFSHVSNAILYALHIGKSVCWSLTF